MSIYQYLIVVLISLITDKFEHLYICLLAIWTSFVKYLLNFVFLSIALFAISLLMHRGTIFQEYYQLNL